ncbi:MAG: LysE family transporter [Planctomycetaceae bacterium]|jgi:threonine/homoserine/homoserine lactone efflux protein|nr:LysE family transporter [Planctomycetaceae bacterium]
MISLLWQAILLGLQAGLSPGPVTTMLVTESLRHGRRAGMKIALVPVLTDVPVICIIIPLLYFLTANTAAIIGVISMVGAVLLCYLGIESLTVSKKQFEQNNVPSMSLFKAIGLNVFNPNLYIYWIGICGPICVAALHSGGVQRMLSFILPYYLSLTGAKLAAAFAVGSVRKSLNVNIIVWLNRLLGVSMFLFAVMFFWTGVKIFTGLQPVAGSR